jgi:hypothetical protein
LCIFALRIFALRIFAQSITFLNMNPFIFGKVVESANFCPRDALIEDLDDAIQTGQNVVLYGRRRVGKSSLVLNAAKQNPKRLFMLIDLFFTKDAAMFLEYSTNALFAFNAQRKGLMEKGMQALKRLRPRMDLDPQSGTPSLSLGLSREDPQLVLHTIDDFFAFLESEFKADQLLVCFDEFQSVLQYPEADVLLAKIRSKVQYHKFPYIFTGSDRSGLKRIFADEGSPFYKSARAIEVPSIERATFEPFLRRKFTSGKRKLEPEIWDAVFKLEITGDVQQLCSALWQSSKAGTTLNAATLDMAYQRIFGQEIEGFRNLLGNLPALQLRVLKDIARNGTDNLYSRESQQRIEASSSSIRRAVNALIDKWVLIKDHNTIYFNNPFLRLFIQQQLP